MLENIKLFATSTDRSTYEEGDNYVEPYVSLVEGDNSVYYNKPKFKAKLILNDESEVIISGSGELISNETGPYRANIVSVEVGELCTSIGNGAFTGSSGLSSISIPNTVTSIGDWAFQTCRNLTNITIPNSVTSIGADAFEFCSSLSNITIPSSVTSIGNYAFQGCSNLFTITSHIMNAPSVNNSTFGYAKNGGTLYVPIGSSGYETWMNDQGNLGMYNWTKVEQ